MEIQGKRRLQEQRSTTVRALNEAERVGSQQLTAIQMEQQHSLFPFPKLTEIFFISQSELTQPCSIKEQVHNTRGETSRRI